MRVLFLLFLCFNVGHSQTISDCKKRFDNYLNFKGSLSNLVKFEKDSIVIHNSKGQKEFTAYQKELPMLAEVFEHYDFNMLSTFYKAKANKKLYKHQRDSIQIYLDRPKNNTIKQNKGNLTGVKIAIDAGHLASSFTEAMNEQKFLYFLRDSIKSVLDTVKLFEGDLTYKTSIILKNMLEEKGATVFLTRPTQSLSSFGISYSTWFNTRKQIVLDSLMLLNKLDAKEYRKLNNLPEYNFFWDFFRDYELVNRARIINEFKPHLTLIIHYNVDEKNVPWKKTTPANFTMAFIGGCFTAERLETIESKFNFMRLLFSNQLNASEHLAKHTVEQFHENLQIPIACQDDADYLKNNCLSAKSHGVYSRQLILCNKINSPLVYGESLYQDNIDESKWLMDNSKTYYGIATNDRVYKVALSYFNAVINYLGK